MGGLANTVETLVNQMKIERGLPIFMRSVPLSGPGACDLSEPQVFEALWKVAEGGG